MRSQKKLIVRPGMIMVGLGIILPILLLLFTLANSLYKETGRQHFTLQLSAYAASASNGQAVFEQKCQGCHTIGGGKTVGPDLKGVTSRRDREWLIKFITTPDQIIARGDPLAKQLLEEYNGILMPNMGLSDADADDILSYIEARSGGEPSAPIKEPEPTLFVTRGDASMGRSIFTGAIPLENGGASCVSCHDISGIGALGGGTLARSLDGAYDRLGDQGLASIMKTAPFPIMLSIYGKQPLNDDEIADLVTFLHASSVNQEAAPSQSLYFVILGTVGLLLIAGIFQLLWRGRLSGVRQSLVKGGSK
jgi:mono/diheme cytochrome c family protein